jgi:hypothetical protein
MHKNINCWYVCSTDQDLSFGIIAPCVCAVSLLVVSLCVSDASPATFETPLDARREDDHPEPEEESAQKTHVEEKDGPSAVCDDKASQDSNKGKETLGVFLKGTAA